MKVYFGRENGEKTLGEIIKLNPAKAKVKTLELRGNGRGSAIGTEWGVPYSLLEAADANAQPSKTSIQQGDALFPLRQPLPKEPLTYNPIAGEDNLILEAIATVYSHLEPDSLSADGELSRTVVRQRCSELTKKLRHLEAALGYSVDEVEVYAWLDSKREGEEARKTA